MAGVQTGGGGHENSEAKFKGLLKPRELLMGQISGREEPIIGPSDLVLCHQESAGTSRDREGGLGCGHWLRP